MCDTVHTNEAKYTIKDVDDMDVDENGPPEHLRDSIALKKDCILLLNVLTNELSYPNKIFKITKTCYHDQACISDLRV